MLHIYLARHGQDEDNAEGLLNGRRDRTLTSIGLEQAAELATNIKAAGLKFERIYSSPLERAYKTANIIAETTDSPQPEKYTNLIERDFGVMTGQPVADIALKCAPDIIIAEKIIYFLDPPGAETFPELLVRAKNVLNEIAKRHSDGNILLVTHGDIGKMIYASYYKLPWRDVLTAFHFGNSELLVLSPESSADETHVFHIKQHN